MACIVGHLYFTSLKMGTRPGWCGSVDWVPACEPKRHWFNSPSGHMPRLWARSLVGGLQKATNGCFSPYLSPSLPLSLKINKIFKKENGDSAVFTNSLGLGWFGEGPNQRNFCLCLGESLFDFWQGLCSWVMVMVSVWTRWWNSANYFGRLRGRAFPLEYIYIIMTQSYF